MRRGFAPVAAAAAVALWSGVPGDAAGLSTGQSALPKIGLTAQDVRTWATGSALDAPGGMISWDTPTLSGAAMKGIAAMTAAERTALVREVLSAVKAALSAPSFQAEFAGKIKKSLNAVDHGIDTRTYGTGPPENPMGMMMVTQMRQVFDMLGPAELVNMWEEERAELAQRIKDETGEERATAQKDLARLNALAPLKGKPDEFKKAYFLAKSASMGGPDTEAGMQAAVATGAEQDRIRREQHNWNNYNLKVQLRSQLEAWIKSLSGYDFSIATRIEGGYVVAADLLQVIPEDPLTQLVYRLGRAPTDAAVQFMRTWLKDLGK